MTKDRLKKIRIAGTWHIDLAIDLHAESRVEIDKFLMEVMDEIQHEVKRIGRKKDYKVNVKAVDARAKSGI